MSRVDEGCMARSREDGLPATSIPLDRKKVSAFRRHAVLLVGQLIFECRMDTINLRVVALRSSEEASSASRGLHG